MSRTGAVGVVSVGALQSRQSEARVSCLDSVRGIAAIVVVFHHRLLTFKPFDEVRIHGIRAHSWARVAVLPPFYFLWDGCNAVFIFFALSGLVLTLMHSGLPTSWAAFAVKRFCRIYLRHAVAIAPRSC
jgi:peptidoglycan/LPS O-acetylase OafA/YrhL